MSGKIAASQDLHRQAALTAQHSRDVGGAGTWTVAMRVLASLGGRRGLGRPSLRLSMASWIRLMSISAMSLRTCRHASPRHIYALDDSLLGTSCLLGAIIWHAC